MHCTSMPFAVEHAIDVGRHLSLTHWFGVKCSLTKSVHSLGRLRVLSAAANMIHGLDGHKIPSERIIRRTLRLIAQGVLLEPIVMRTIAQVAL